MSMERSIDFQDNATNYIEEGHYGGKGSDLHKIDRRALKTVKFQYEHKQNLYVCQYLHVS